MAKLRNDWGHLRICPTLGFQEVEAGGTITVADDEAEHWIAAGGWVPADAATEEAVKAAAAARAAAFAAAIAAEIPAAAAEPAAVATETPAVAPAKPAKASTPEGKKP